MTKRGPILWFVLQHVLPKGFRRARSFVILHSNCKCLITLLRLLSTIDSIFQFQAACINTDLQHTSFGPLFHKSE